MSDADIEVRIGSAADAPALATLRYQWRAGERGERGLGPSAFEVALGAWMQRHESSHVAFLAVRGVAPVGMAWLALVERVPGPEHFNRTSAYIQSTYVAPPERAAGVGTRIVCAVLDHAAALGVEYLVVHPSERAFRFYQRLGFAETTRVLELRD